MTRRVWMMAVSVRVMRMVGVRCVGMWSVAMRRVRVAWAAVRAVGAEAAASEIGCGSAVVAVAIRGKDPSDD